jgi:RNase adaptor protein for sRNA GlmZ degradation
LPELRKVLAALAQNEELKKFDFEDANGLKVTINSFSYKKGLPIDYSGNGGGFVFDCRVLKNPGKYPKYFDLTGKDKAVIDFLEAESKVSDFLESVYSLVDDTVENYNRRNFKNLMINFGCTGGQHRSVYCAEKLASHLIDKFKANIDLNHTQLNRKD